MTHVSRWLLIGFGAVALCMHVGASSAGERDTAQGKQSLTIVEPTATGGVQILHLEEKGDAANKPKPAASGTGSAGAAEDVRKARIIVVPAVYAQGARSKFDRELMDKFGLSSPTAVENPGFTGHIVDALVKSRKFDVLEREALRDVVKEIDFGESDYADTEKTARAGKMLNADYVLIPEIRHLLIVTETKEVPYVGTKRGRVEATLATNVRIVDVRTSRIASSEVAETTYGEKIEKRPGELAKQAVKFMDNVFAAAAAREVAKAIDTVYPIRVIALDQATVTLNRGAGALAPGEKLTVYAAGEELIDPDTKENLGVNEAKVGVVEVTEVRAKVSVAKILEGQGRIQKLQVCRRTQEAKKPLPARPPKID